MKSKQAIAAAEALLRDTSFQLEAATKELNGLRATLERTKATIRSSREAIVRTNKLVQPDEWPDQDCRRTFS